MDDIPDIETSILAETRSEVGYADHKASMVLASVGIGFGALVGGYLAGSWRPSSLDPWAEVIWWLGILLSALSVLFASAAVWPRYRTPEPDQIDEIHYWGDAAAFDNLRALCDRLDEQKVSHRDRTREQMWQLSRIVSTKYRFVRRSFVAAGAAIFAFILTLVSEL